MINAQIVSINQTNFRAKQIIDTCGKTPSNELVLMPSDLVEKMPRLYTQDGKGKAAIVYAHLFGPSGDWWLTEVNEDGTEAFGFVRLAVMPDCAELGYISITELQELVDSEFIAKKDIRFLIEREKNWEPCTLGDVMKNSKK